MRTLTSFLLILNATIVFSQTLDSFRLDFKSALSPTFSEDDLIAMKIKHHKILTYYSYGQQQSDSSQLVGPQFPLRTFRKDSLYVNNLPYLLSSANIDQRLLAFMVIGAAGDSSMAKPLLHRMAMEQNPSLLYHGAISLYLIGCQETTPIFDLLVKNEEFGPYYFHSFYVHLNKDSLLQTALSRIGSDDPKAKTLAAYVLGFTKITKASETALRKAVQEWDIPIKGYAIISLKQLQVGNLLPLLKPLLNDPLTRGIALESLVESPDEKDFRYVKRLAEKENPVTVEVLNGFYKSTKPEAVKHWLYLLRTKPLPEKRLWFSVNQQPLLSIDALLPEVRRTLRMAKDVYVLQQLSRALQGRTDDKSVQLIIDLLRHPDPKVRFWVADWNKNCRTPILAKEIPALLADSQLRVVPLTTMAIENEIDTLQTLFEGIYKNPLVAGWQEAAVDYLSTFPKMRHRAFFIELLEGDNRQRSIGVAQQAALGLGRLKDVAADDLIIQSSHLWREESDSNAYYHLLALQMLKTEKAKAEIQKYLTSKEKQMREFAQRALDNWE